MLQSEDVFAYVFQKHAGEYASGIPAWSGVAQAPHKCLSFGARLFKRKNVGIIAMLLLIIIILMRVMRIDAVTVAVAGTAMVVAVVVSVAIVLFMIIFVAMATAAVAMIIIVIWTIIGVRSTFLVGALANSVYLR